MSQAEQVTVSGGSGYIASFIIAKLLDQGYKVHTTIRNVSRSEIVRANISKLSTNTSSLSFFQADLNADEGWKEALENSKFGVHVASPFPAINPKSADELINPAKDGALRFLKAAKAQSVNRVVLTSSMAAISYGVDAKDKRVRTEADWTDINHPDATISPYVLSKTIAEKAAWEYANSVGLELAVVNPCAVLGPVISSDYSTSIEIVSKMLRGELLAIPKVGFNIVDVRDVADLHILAMLAPNAKGQRFAALNEFMWFGEIAKILKDELGEAAKKVPTANLPNFALHIAAIFDPVVRNVIPELGRERLLSNAKATSELGWKPIDTRQTIIDTASSLIEANAV